MFDNSPADADGAPGPATVGAVGTGIVAGWMRALAFMGQDLDKPEKIGPVDEAVLVGQLRVLEDLKSAAAAAQARIALGLDTVRRRAEAQAGIPAQEQGRGVGAEIALARRESPARGSRLLGLARILLTDMPHTLTALETGVLNEWRVTLVVRETVCLSNQDRRSVDAELAADTGTLDGVGDRSLVARTRSIAYRLDPEVVAARARKAATERYVSCRPAPDTMAYLTALLPVTEAVSVFTALSRDADTRHGAGDERGRAQIMADTLVERLTGTPVGTLQAEIQLVMTDRTLLHGGNEPAYLPGYGTVPAPWARDLLHTGNTSETNAGNTTGSSGTGDGSAGRSVADVGAGVGVHPGNSSATGNQAGDQAGGPAGAAETQVWLRRLYTAPGTGQLVGMDSRSRFLPPGLRRLIQTRDGGTCRTPYCDAPIRHADHVIPWKTSHTTTDTNSQGLCEHCNQTKETPGWSSQPHPGPRHTIETRTPTGHTYHSTAPPPPGTPGTPPHSRHTTHEPIDLITPSAA